MNGYNMNDYNICAKGHLLKSNRIVSEHAKHLESHLTLRFFRSNVMSALLYENEAWKPSASIAESLQVPPKVPCCYFCTMCDHGRSKYRDNGLA